MAIRRAVQSGQVAVATELVNELDPDVSLFFSFLAFFLLRQIFVDHGIKSRWQFNKD